MATKTSNGTVDSVSIAYILCGIPAMTAFTIVLFILVHLFNIPA